MFLSIVIPCYNEEEVLPLLNEKLECVLSEMLLNNEINNYEVIYVDDGSKDDTWMRISAFHKRNLRIKGLKFLRNFGHHAALSAGIDFAEGDAIILMDADLQEPPEAIPMLLSKYKQGYDIVYCIRKSRKDPLLKKIVSYLFWQLMNMLSGLHMPVNQFTLRIFSRDVCNALKSMREVSRFMAGMIAWVGGKSTFIEVEHQKRMYGKTKYNFYKLLKLAISAVASFSIVPLRLAVTFGCGFAMLSFIGAIYVICQKVFYGIPILGWASIMVAIFFVGGVQLLVIGIIGQYLGMVYREVQQRPLYLIKDRLL